MNYNHLAFFNVLLSCGYPSMNLTPSGFVLTIRPIPPSHCEDTSINDSFTEAEWLCEWKIEEGHGENW